MTNTIEKISKRGDKSGGINLSDSAINHLLKQLAKYPQAKGVRLSLTKTGCSGLSYKFDFVESEMELDRHYQFGNLKVYVDHKSYPYLKGLKIDFVKEGLNHKYIYENPNQTGQCGCGESFTIE